jgi:hypothetical protein
VVKAALFALPSSVVFLTTASTMGIDCPMLQSTKLLILSLTAPWGLPLLYSKLLSLAKTLVAIFAKLKITLMVTPLLV